MEYDDLFVSEVPKRLSNKETVILFDRMKQGDMKAREELISGNIDLVIRCIRKNFMDTNYDKKELVSVGCIGLVKAVDTYSVSKCKSYFSTLAGNYIHVEIERFINELNKDSNVIGFDDLAIILKDEVSIEERYEEKEHRDYVYSLLEESMGCLSERNIEIIKLYFGFYDKKYNCRELAKIYNISASEVSSLVIRCLRRVKERMEEIILIDKFLMDVRDNILKRSKNK